MLREHEIELRVRYQETDPMGFLHHAFYFTYFEIGRTELLRASGGNYRRMEEEGLLSSSCGPNAATTGRRDTMTCCGCGRRSRGSRPQKSNTSTGSSAAKNCSHWAT